MADDRGQDVVEVVGNSAGELADRLHLGSLRDLALELGFLAIVLEQKQDRGIAKAAQPGDRQAPPAPWGWASRTAMSPDIAGPRACLRTASATAPLSSLTTKSLG
jgi:hypothetical protein